MIWEQRGFSDRVNETRWNLISTFLLKPNHHLGEISPLFVKVDEDEIEKYKKQLGLFE
jgi:methionyl-tRNA synthetase